MTPSAAEIAQEFLLAVWDNETPSIKALSQSLDRLLARSHDIPFADCSDEDRDPPKIDIPALYQEVAVRFPDLGMYPVADPLAPLDDDKMMADAIDDIADITRDLREVIWREAHLGVDDANWYFRIMFFHWGRHARELSLYLHARQFD
ncbi:hypothetical protein [Sphingomonas sp. DC1100-1]|uniref:hypothetical protein n=1 Tax=unclassified Sphingomonas TaxID=196159 RepID=UPI003CF3881A